MCHLLFSQQRSESGGGCFAEQIKSHRAVWSDEISSYGAEQPRNGPRKIILLGRDEAVAFRYFRANSTSRGLEQEPSTYVKLEDSSTYKTSAIPRNPDMLHRT